MTTSFTSQRETLYTVFQRSPQEALERMLANARFPWESDPTRDGAFLWQACYDQGNNTRYGSYRKVTRAELLARKHQLYFTEGAVNVLWLDVYHDLINNQNVPVSTQP